MPFGVAFLEATVNFVVVFTLYYHPLHVHWLIDVAGLLSLLKHVAWYLCYALVLVGALLQLLRALNANKKLE